MTGVDGVRRWRAQLTPLALVAIVAAMLLVRPAPAQAVDEEDPLEVTLTSITPSSIPRSGPVVITGQVRNPTDEVWRQVRVYPVFSETPMTAPEEVAAAAASVPATTASGSRLTGEGQFATISRLRPGASASFRIRLPRRELPISGAPGVYWVGAQALGTNESGRDLLADGRARSFMSLVPRKTSARLTLIAPLRQHVERDVRARVVDPAETASLFGDRGRLGRLLGVLADAPAVTWLVDPALLDIAADLGDNNPPLSLGPDQPPEEPSPSPSTDPPENTEKTGAGNSQGSPARALDQDARDDTIAWLDQLTRTLSAASVLALPYADADGLALMRKSPGTLQEAQDLAEKRLSVRGLSSTPAVAPPNRRLDADLLATAPGNLIALASAPTPLSPATASFGDHQVVLSQPAATSGGPGPTRALSALNLRQRILAEAALHAISGSTDRLVITLPDDWDPGGRWRAADFTGGLDTTWLELARLPSGSTGRIDDLPYSHADRRSEIDRDLIRDVQGLIGSSSRLSALLDTENNVALRLRSMALRGASYAGRRDQATAASLVNTMNDTVEGLLNRVSVLGTQFVTLSGGAGTITVSLVNDLPQPVKIGLDVSAREKDRLDFEEIEPVTLQPQQRTTTRLQVRTSRLGVNEVTITPVTTGGDKVGTPLEVTIRSSEVGRWFWSVMIGAAAVLVVMIGKRIRDRIRHRHWRPVDDEPVDAS